MTTFAELKTRARRRADMEGSNFVSDEEMGEFVNASACELYDILIAAFADYYLQSTTATVSGTDEITIPANLYKLRGVDRDVGGRWASIDPFSFQERNDRQNASIYNRRDSGIRYRLQGSVVKLTPSSCDGSYRLWYVPRLAELVSDSDVFDGVNGYEDYIVVDAAIKALQKEESSTTTLERQKAALLKRIEAMSKNRDASGPEVIVDSSRNGWWY